MLFSFRIKFPQIKIFDFIFIIKGSKNTIKIKIILQPIIHQPTMQIQRILTPRCSFAFAGNQCNSPNVPFSRFCQSHQTICTVQRRLLSISRIRKIEMTHELSLALAALAMVHVAAQSGDVSAISTLAKISHEQPVLKSFLNELEQQTDDVDELFNEEPDIRKSTKTKKLL